MAILVSNMFFNALTFARSLYYGDVKIDGRANALKKKGLFVIIA